MLTPIINKLEKLYEYKNEYLYPSIEVSFHGFFKPYKTLEEVGSQLATPFAMFITCLTKMIWYIFESLWYLLFMAPGQLLCGKLEEAKEALENSRDDFVESMYFLYSLIVDPIREWVAFFIRTGATIDYHIKKHRNAASADKAATSSSNSESSFCSESTGDTLEEASYTGSQVTSIAELI